MRKRGRPVLFPEGVKTSELHIRLDHDVLTELQDIAKRFGLSAPAYVRSMIYNLAHSTGDKK